MTIEHPSRLQQQTIALAGVAQAARLVDQISKTGSYPLEFLEPSIHSLFVFEQNSAQEIFGGLAGVKLGLHNLASLMANRQAQENHEVARYFLSLMYLERRFASNAEMMAVVRSRLEHTSFKAEHFSSNVSALCQSVSGIYQDTLSKQKFRIRVSGSATHLENSQNADIIRATLLAGVRSAFLWHQLGGRRWQLLFTRRKVLQCAQELSRGLAVV